MKYELSLLEKRYTKATGKPTRVKFAGSEVPCFEYLQAIEKKVYHLEAQLREISVLLISTTGANHGNQTTPPTPQKTA